MGQNNLAAPVNPIERRSDVLVSRLWPPPVAASLRLGIA